jgi:PhnB protein
MELAPYLFFDSGTCEEALNFYKDLFKGEITGIMRWKDGPPEMQGDPAHGNRVMHSDFKAPGVHFMASDARPTTRYGDGRISLSLDTPDEKEARRLWEALARGGKVEVELEKVFWGALFGMLTDKYGVDWMVNCQLEPMPGG